MARISSLLLPDSKTSIAISLIARIAAYDNGVGIFNPREKMIGWIPTQDDTVASLVVVMIDEIINNPGHAKKPDWSILKSAA
jgi:hypothetical protein